MVSLANPSPVIVNNVVGICFFLISDERERTCVIRRHRKQARGESEGNKKDIKLNAYLSYRKTLSICAYKSGQKFEECVRKN